MTGKITVLRPGAPMHGRAILKAVVRSVCSNCGGCYGVSPNPARIRSCTCPEGWTGTVTDLGVLADSGPTGWKRPLWRFGEQIREVVDAVKTLKGKAV